MTLTVFPDVEQGSPEWFDQRRGLVTASVVGQLISMRKLSAIDYACPACAAPALDPCRSKRSDTAIKTLHPERAEFARGQNSSTVIEPASNDVSRGLTLRLAAERINGWTEPTFTNDDMCRGIECEPIARDLYSQKYAPVTQVGFMVLERDGVRLGYSPDGLVGDDGLLEIKAPRAKGHLTTVLAGNPPIEHMPQIQAGLLVSGRKWLDFISFYGGMHMFVKRVYPDQRWFDAIVRAVRAFEDNCAEIVRLYDEAVVGLHMTERVSLDPEFT